MTELFLRLVGLPVSDALRIVDVSLAFRGGMSVGWFVLLLLAAGGLIYWMYRASPVLLPAWRRHLLSGLRLLFVMLCLALLLRPVLALTVEGSVRRVLVMLLDSSLSMQIADPRLDDEDQKRAAIARDLLDPESGLAQPLNASAASSLKSVPRVDVLKSVLRNPRLELLPRLEKEFDLSAFSFGQGIAELGVLNTGTNAAAQLEPNKPQAKTYEWVDRLEPTSPFTAMGDAIRGVLNRKRGQPLAGIVLCTDGVNNSGSQPHEAALIAREEDVPLYIYGVGITSPRDIIIQNLFAPDITFVRDEVQVSVRVRSQGLSGEGAELQLKLGDEIVATQTLAFGADTERVIPMKFIPQNLGEFELTAEIQVRPDEAVEDNNVRSQRLKVIDARIKALLVDQSPRWEFRYLQAMFLRDRRVDLHCVLFEGDPGIGRVEGSPFLPQFPSRRDQLFQYDLIILGDVDPKVLSIQQQENLHKLVSDFGSGLVILAGKRFMPRSYRRTVLDRMLPVEFDALTLQPKGDVLSDRPIQLELTAAGRDSPVLRLSDNADMNVKLWAELPPVYWVAKVSRAKPAAEVLLVDPDPARESRFGRMPVVAVQQYGLGQVMFIGTDNTWRWRKNVGDAYFTAIWGQIAQRTSIQRLLGVSKRTQLTMDRQNYLTGDRVTIYARLYSGVGYDPVREPDVKGSFRSRDDSGASASVILRPLPEQPAMYRGEFTAPAPGVYSFSVDLDPATEIDFSVTEPKFEFGETSMNQMMLSELGASTGGEFFREEDLHRLPDTIRAKTDRVRSPMEVELWSSPLYFLVMLGIISAEWVLRKLSFLK